MKTEMKILEFFWDCRIWGGESETFSFPMKIRPKMSPVWRNGSIKEFEKIFFPLKFLYENRRNILRLEGLVWRIRLEKKL